MARKHDRPTSLAVRHGCRPEVPLLLAAAAVLLYLGITEPVIHTRTLIFWRNSIAIWPMLYDHWQRGDELVAVLIASFAIGIPAAKLIMLAILWCAPFTRNARRQMLMHTEFLSRWAMLDVFIIAVLVVLLQMPVLINAEPRIGLYLFAGSIIMSMTATLLIARATRRS